MKSAQPDKQRAIAVFGFISTAPGNTLRISGTSKDQAGSTLVPSATDISAAIHGTVAAMEIALERRFSMLIGCSWLR
jgi:hypothetical protein